MLGEAILAVRLSRQQSVARAAQGTVCRPRTRTRRPRWVQQTVVCLRRLTRYLHVLCIRICPHLPAPQNSSVINTKRPSSLSHPISTLPAERPPVPLESSLIITPAPPPTPGSSWGARSILPLRVFLVVFVVLFPPSPNRSTTITTTSSSSNVLLSSTGVRGRTQTRPELRSAHGKSP